MADTIVNTPAGQDSGAAGWVVALFIMLAIVAGGYLWYRTYGAPRAAAPVQDRTDINITLPEVPNAGGGGNVLPPVKEAE